MKKIFSTLLVIAASAGAAFSQCTVDPTNTEFLSPVPSEFPCIVRTQAFSNAIQFTIPSQFNPGTGNVTIDSVVITGINSQPTGITYACNPNGCVFPGGTQGCLNFQGTTTDAVGTYNVNFEGFLYYSPSNPLLPSPINFATLSAFPQAPQFAYELEVINDGDVCHDTTSTGIKSFSKELNSMMYVYPNPNNGSFELRLNAGNRVNGTVVVIDVTGKVVYTQAIDAVGTFISRIELGTMPTGLYTVQLRTAEGFAAKTISIQ